MKRSSSVFPKTTAGRTFRVLRSVNGIGSSTMSFREQFIEDIVLGIIPGGSEGLLRELEPRCTVGIRGEIARLDDDQRTEDGYRMSACQISDRRLCPQSHSMLFPRAHSPAQIRAHPCHPWLGKPPTPDRRLATLVANTSSGHI